MVPSGNEKMMLFVKALLSTGRQIAEYCFRGIQCLHMSLTRKSARAGRGYLRVLVRFTLLGLRGARLSRLSGFAGTGRFRRSLSE